MANAGHRVVHKCFKILRKTAEGQEALEALLLDSNPYVRQWAGAHCLFLGVPPSARDVLEALRDSDGPGSFDAKMVLREFERGRLTFDY